MIEMDGSKMDIHEQAAQIAQQALEQARDNDVFAYRAAWETGAFEVMLPIIERAESDAVLWPRLKEIDDECTKEDGIVVSEEELSRIKQMIHRILED